MTASSFESIGESEDQPSTPGACAEQKQKILVTSVVALNGGDAAILKAVVNSLNLASEGKAEMTILDRYADVSNRLYPEYNFINSAMETCRPSWGGGFLMRLVAFARAINLLAAAMMLRLTRGRHAWLGLSSEQWRLLDLYRDSRAVVSTGGTMFVEKYNLFPHALGVWLGYILGKPVILYTQSFEPVRKPLNRAIMYSVLAPAAIVLVRGEQSRRIACGLGARETRVTSLPDVVFRFEKAARPRPTRMPPRIFISVRHWTYTSGGSSAQKRYRTEFAKLCTKMVRDWNAQIVFISTCQGVPEYALDDSDEARQIWALLEDSTKANVSVDCEFHRPEELMEVFGSADVVVATRLHACILALCAGVPTIPVSYERKTEEVFDRIYPGLDVQTFELMDADILFAQIDGELRNREQRVTDLTHRVRDEAADSRRADALVKKILW